MSAPIPVTTIKDFLVNGTRMTPVSKFQPSDETGDLTTIQTALVAGLATKHIKAGSLGQSSLAKFRLLVFTGADATGGAELCTCTGAVIGDTVVGVINLTDLTTGNAQYQATITTVDKIRLNAAVNHSAKKLAVLLIAEGI